MPYLGILGARILKTIVIFEISTPKFVKNQSLTRTVNFGEFWVRVRVRLLKYAKCLSVGANFKFSNRIESATHLVN